MTNQNPMTLPVYSDQAISRMFCDYVDSTNCKERHTAAAVRDYDVFADYVENETRSSNTVQNALLEKAMDFAVEYEESGFIAGFRWAVMMFLHGAPEPPAEAPERASEPPTRKLQPEPAKPAPAPSAPPVICTSKKSRSTRSSSTSPVAAARCRSLSPKFSRLMNEAFPGELDFSR